MGIESVIDLRTAPAVREPFPSPDDWRNELIYFVVVDRFSDGKEGDRKLYIRDQELQATDWNAWAESGRARYQGGTLDGITSKLPYLRSLGVTTVWVSPITKQRVELDTYHGYSAQNFLEVEPRLGTIESLRHLVEEAHKLRIYVILDVVINHSGCNWVYMQDEKSPQYSAENKRKFGGWVAADESVTDTIRSLDDGVWPRELQKPEIYHRAGTGDLGEGDAYDPQAENKRSDFYELRTFDHRVGTCLDDLIQIFQYWISATDCDGFRIDTLKHVTVDTARRFCHAMKEHARSIGKSNFLLLGEVAGGDSFQEAAQTALGDTLDATLDIGEARVALTECALGSQAPADYFRLLDDNGPMVKYRTTGRHVTVLDDHDLVCTAPDTQRLRFAARTDNQERVLLALAIQLFGPGIPCLYYGTEQALSGPATDLEAINGWGHEDHFLRETLFGATHPRQKGRDGHASDVAVPGFAAFGALGYHLFDVNFWLYASIAEMAKLRQNNAVFTQGSYIPSGFLGANDKIAAFSRLLGNIEAFVVMNFDSKVQEGGRLWVHMNPGKTKARILFDSKQTLGSLRESTQAGGDCARTHGELSIQTNADGKFFVQLPQLAEYGVLVFVCEPK